MMAERPTTPTSSDNTTINTNRTADMAQHFKGERKEEAGKTPKKKFLGRINIPGFRRDTDKAHASPSSSDRPSPLSPSPNDFPSGVPPKAKAILGPKRSIKKNESKVKLSQLDETASLPADLAQKLQRQAEAIRAHISPGRHPRRGKRVFSAGTIAEQTQPPLSPQEKASALLRSKSLKHVDDSSTNPPTPPAKDTPKVGPFEHNTVEDYGLRISYEYGKDPVETSSPDYERPLALSQSSKQFNAQLHRDISRHSVRPRIESTYDQDQEIPKKAPASAPHDGGHKQRDYIAQNEGRWSEGQLPSFVPLVGLGEGRTLPPVFYSPSMYSSAPDTEFHPSKNVRFLRVCSQIALDSSFTCPFLIR